MISIIIPIYNEEENIEVFFDKLINVLRKIEEDYEIIFIDDGSEDRSFEKLNNISKNNKNIKIIQFTRNFGHQIALTAGIDFASGDAVIMMDADLQHPPELIPELIKKWKEGYDIVYTIRTSTKGSGFFKKISSKFFYFLINKISKIDIPEGAADFRLLSRPVVETLKNFKERTRFIRGIISYVGYKKFAIPYVAEVRYAGKSKYSFIKMLKFAINGIISFSSFPLYISALLGFVISGISFIYGLHAIYARFFTNKVVPGWTSILLSVLFLGGIQLIAIGILGGYLAKVYEEVKQRPLYIINKQIGFTDEKK